MTAGSAAGDVRRRGPRTVLVGRETEVAAVGAALVASRVVTVTGLGGTGKTRVAVEAAHRFAPRHGDGALWVSLAGLSSPEGVVAAIGAAAARDGGGPVPSPGAGGVLAGIGAADLLLILDECEHVLDEAAWVVDRLLEAGPALRVLATSREPLRVGGESVVAIGPLPIEPCRLTHPADAVQLFVQRAAAVRHDFALTSANLDEIVELCRSVDGIPLAIELAAAHVGYLSVAEIRARLEQRPDTLVSRERAPVARHRTLTAALDWSYRGLAETERSTLRALAAFVDGASAAAVAAASGIDDLVVHDRLSRLVDKHLVLAEERSGSVHYRSLGTVRRYAFDRLAASGELAAVRRRQVAWLTASFTASGRGRLAPSSAAGPDDVLAVLDWTLEVGETALSLSLAAATWSLWEATGRHAEGRRLLEVVLAQAGSERSLASARVRVAAAQLAFVGGDLAAARSHHELAIGQLRELAAEPELAAALHAAAMVVLFGGDVDAARRLAEEAFHRFEALGDELGVAFAQTSLGVVEAHAQRPDDAERHLLDALRRFRQAGARREAASVLDDLGNLAADLGAPARAHRYYEGALQLQQQVGDDRGAALSLNGLSLVAQCRGNLDRAWEHADAARQLFRRIGDRSGAAATLNNLANLASERGRPAEAMQLYTECIRSFRELGDVRRVAIATENLAELARSVGERQLAWDLLIESAWAWHAAGDDGGVRRGVTALDELARSWGVAGAEALGELAHADDGASSTAVEVLEAVRWVVVPPPPEPATAPPGRLTPRERQVVGLVATGRSNAEIARELFVSERTVESHISNARLKLGIDSRTKLTRWALEEGLAG